MAFDLKNLGVKLTRYREQLTETVDQVAMSTDIELSRLRAIEAGEIEPTGDEVLILADYYRCDYKFFISNERVAPFEQTETLYRAHGREFSKEDRRAIQEFLYLCETEAFLMEELGRNVKQIPFTWSGSYYKGHGEQAALTLRRELGYQDNDVPNDVYADFRSAGAHVFRRRLSNSNISGVFVAHPVAGGCILVNHNEDLYRQRFSAAHEMAHAIFDVDQSASISYLAPTAGDLRETRANRFASCYLMPPSILRKLPDPKGWDAADAVSWASKLRVSCDALGVALKEAGLADAQTSGRIRRFRVPRDAKIDPELPPGLTGKQRQRKEHLLELGLSDAYVELCFDGLREGLISVGRVAEALLCSKAELFEVAAIYGRKLYAN